VQEESAESWDACPEEVRKDIWEALDKTCPKQHLMSPHQFTQGLEQRRLLKAVWSPLREREDPSVGGTFMLDPLDGTRDYVSGGHWAVGLAWTAPRSQWPTMAAMVCPTLSFSLGCEEKSDGTLLCEWMHGVSAYVAHGTTWVRRSFADDVEEWRRPVDIQKFVSVGKYSLVHSAHHAGALTEWCDYHSWDAAARSAMKPMGSMAKFVVVLLGQADLYVRIHNPKRPEKTWDHAAGVALAVGAGCVCMDADTGGSPITSIPTESEWHALRGLCIQRPGIVDHTSTWWTDTRGDDHSEGGEDEEGDAVEKDWAAPYESTDEM
jgi:3'-phosphoadenosine 5'-phosphosulfate (PAPS) 3'-phosphatase